MPNNHFKLISFLEIVMHRVCETNTSIEVTVAPFNWYEFMLNLNMILSVMMYSKMPSKMQYQLFSDLKKCAPMQVALKPKKPARMGWIKASHLPSNIILLSVYLTQSQTYTHVVKQNTIDRSYFFIGHNRLYCQYISTTLQIKSEMENKPNVIFVLGGPGSGKGTHCDLIRQRYNLTHYSVGDILREFLKSGTKEAQLISQMMKEGQMVSSQTVVKSIKDKILKGDKSKKILLDGFPRNQDNITAWNNIVGDQIKVQLLIYIDVSDDAMRSRLLNRGKTSGRLDDTAEIIQKRLVTFHQETQPVLIHYKRLYAQGHFKVLNVNGEITIDVAQERIKKFFALNHIA